jgi:putative peptide zinc metalloprotease protein
MAQLRLGYPEIQRSGAEVLQITHNTPAEAGRYFKHYPIAFPYLCDPDRAVHEAYGLPLSTASARDVVSSLVTSATDLVRTGEKTALPLSFALRYGYRDSPQAVILVDGDGIVRHVVQAGPNADLPSNAEILRRLDAM